MISYRQADPHDLKLTFNIKERATRKLIEKIWGWDNTFQLNYHQKQFDPTKIQIISYDHQEIGLISINQSSNGIFLENILIDPDFQGKGIGTSVLQTLLKKADQQKLNIELQVFKINIAAKRLYERLDFVVFNETELHYQMRHEPS